MDKRIRKSKGTNRRLTYGKGGHSYLIMLDRTGGRRRREREKRKRKEREEEGRERSFTFSLVFPVIGPSVFVGARGKVLSHGKSFK